MFCVESNNQVGFTLGEASVARGRRGSPRGASDETENDDVITWAVSLRNSSLINRLRTLQACACRARVEHLDHFLLPRLKLAACLGLFADWNTQVQPSAKREGFATVPGVSWKDVGALASVREELGLSILDPIAFPEVRSYAYRRV